MAFLTLLRIELMRSWVWLLIVAMFAAFAVTDIRFMLWGSFGGRSWFWIGGAAEQLAGVFPFGVAFAAWYAGRSRRNQLEEIDSSNRWLGLGSHAVALVAMISVLAGIVVAVFAAVTVRIWQSSIYETDSAPSGPYPWLQILVILTAFAAFITWGYWFGYRVRSPLAPVIAALIMNWILQLSRRLTFSVDSLSSLGAIIPTRISYELAPYIGDRVYVPLALWGIAWFVVLGVIPILLLRKWGLRRRNGVLQTSIVAILTIVCVFNVSTELRAARSWHADYRPLACVEQSGMRFCAPPGAMPDSDLETIAHYYDDILPAWFPATHLPDQLSIPISGDQLPSNAVPMVSFQHSQERNSFGYMRAILHLIAGPGQLALEPTAAELVVACAMLLDTGHGCGTPHPEDSSQSMPNASDAVEGQMILEPFLQQGRQITEIETTRLEAEMGELQTQIQQKLDNFMALSGEEKASWLDENWDRLSSGELTLDDMP